MKKKVINNSRVPIYRDAGFVLTDARTAAEAFSKEGDNEREPDLYIYSRYRNPTVVSAEKAIMEIEGSRWALLTQSGMSAVDTALSIFQKADDTRPWLFFSEIYGGTISFIEFVLKKRRGIDTHTFTPGNEQYDLNEFNKVIESLQPELVYIETISNPMLIVPDAESIIRIAHKYGVTVIVDNTFATPVLWKPLESGADIVIHSATKYLSGHGNITAGVICGNDQTILKSAVEYRKYTGHMISADDAYRLQTQLETFELRFARQCSSAEMISAILYEDPFVRRVWYPGLESHPTHNEAVRLFKRKGFGGMITFDLIGRNEEEKRLHRDIFIKTVSDKIRLIPSLGDAKSILMPVESVWGTKYPEPGMIRLSVGFENPDELAETIRKGLRSCEV
jgi:cystathionine beta-lyase/cystathionine gamma-synthase